MKKYLNMTKIYVYITMM